MVFVGVCQGVDLHDIGGGLLRVYLLLPGEPFIFQTSLRGPLAQDCLFFGWAGLPKNA